MRRSEGLDLLPFMRRWDMLPPPGGRILCAVSGGRDSMCLLHYLWTLGQRENFSVAAVHMNHGQRETAQRDVLFVQNFCRERGIPCVTEQVSVPEKAKEWGVGIEEAGRRLRYETFRRAAELTCADRIATAHHAADQAETVLLNLLRGTGPEGLAGIPPVRGEIIRPLLETSRQEIEAYLERHGIDHVEDETNGDRSLTRNRLRLDIMPLLRELYPGAEGSICRTAEILRREEGCWREMRAPGPRGARRWSAGCCWSFPAPCGCGPCGPWWSALLWAGRITARRTTRLWSGCSTGRGDFYTCPEGWWPCAGEKNFPWKRRREPRRPWRCCRG